MQMNERFGEGFEASALTFKRGTSRAYFLIASSQHKDFLRERLQKIRSGLWNRHFIVHEKPCYTCDDLSGADPSTSSG
jgi:hypothetical protein